MNLLNVINWIGVFALAVGSIISVVHGGFVIALFATLLTSILITSLIPLNGKLQYLLRGNPRIELIQRGGRWVGMVGSWVLTVIGGWEYLVGAVVLTVAMIGQIWMVMREMRMRRRTGAMISNQPPYEIKEAGLNTVINTPLNTSLTTPSTLNNVSNFTSTRASLPPPPPLYSATSPTTTTVRIVEEKADQPQPQPQQPNQVTIKIDQPIFNV
jgi:hypothetical protein